MEHPAWLGSLDLSSILSFSVKQIRIVALISKDCNVWSLYDFFQHRHRKLKYLQGPSRQSKWVFAWVQTGMNWRAMSSLRWAALLSNGWQLTGGSTVVRSAEFSKGEGHFPGRFGMLASELKFKKFCCPKSKQAPTAGCCHGLPIFSQNSPFLCGLGYGKSRREGKYLRDDFSDSIYFHKWE